MRYVSWVFFCVAICVRWKGDSHDQTRYGQNSVIFVNENDEKRENNEFVKEN